MENRKRALVLIMMALLSAAVASAQDAQYVVVPVGGLYGSPYSGDEFAYDGEVHQLWFPVTDGGGWTVVSMFVAVAYQIGVNRQHLVFTGFSQQAVASSPGEQIELPMAFWVYGDGGMPWFKGSLMVKSTTPPHRFASPSP